MAETAMGGEELPLVLAPPPRSGRTIYLVSVSSCLSALLSSGFIRLAFFFIPRCDDFGS